MKNTKHLLAHSRLYLIAAVFWTLLIAVLCLVSFKELPSVNVKGADKYVHSFLHFVFTILWFIYFKSRFEGKWLLIAFFLSLTYGSLIELMQGLFTETRQADIIDVGANCLGSIIAMLVILIFEKVFTSRNTYY